jgi:predicted AAA+ superfamily ATPase
MITRKLENEIADKLLNGKAIILVGARQTGKTTLLKKIVNQRNDILWMNGDEPDIQAMFENVSSSYNRLLRS